MATRERVYIDKKFIGLADRLVARQIPGTDVSEGVFRDTRELLVLAASLGFRHKKARQVEEQGREVKISVLDRIAQGGAEFVDALAVAHTGDVKVLDAAAAQERARILEEYANGGLEYIQALVDEDAPALEAILEVVAAEHAPKRREDEVVGLLGARLP